MFRPETIDSVSKDKIELLCEETVKLGATFSKLISTKKYCNRALGPIEMSLWLF